MPEMKKHTPEKPCLPTHVLNQVEVELALHQSKFSQWSETHPNVSKLMNTRQPQQHHDVILSFRGPQQPWVDASAHHVFTRRQPYQHKL